MVLYTFNDGAGEPMAAALARSGDVVVGATAHRPSQDEALTEVERLVVLTLARAAASMPEAKD